jgi:hypothetical protein
MLLVAAPALGEGLSADESALNERLRQGRAPASAPTEARLTAAHGALALAQGRRDEALRLFTSVEGFEGDCALLARLADLGAAEPCTELVPGRLDAALLEPPAAFLIVAADEAESGNLFPAAVLATALKALAPAGGLSLESTADRFRATGSAALEGIMYLEDRLLLAARPAPGRGRAEAGEALDAFLALRAPAAVAPGDDSSGVETATEGLQVKAHGVSLELPAGWTAEPRAGRTGNSIGISWPAPGANAADAFPPRGGAVAVKPLRRQATTERRKNPLARRKRTSATVAHELDALPAGAELVDSRVLGGGVTATAVEWRAAGGGGTRKALIRTLMVGGSRVQVVAHLGGQLETEQALQVLDSAAARP